MESTCNFCKEDISEFDEESRTNHQKSCHKANAFLKNFYGQYQCLKCTQFISGVSQAYNHVKDHFAKKSKVGPKSAKKRKRSQEIECEPKRSRIEDEISKANQENEKIVERKDSKTSDNIQENNDDANELDLDAFESDFGDFDDFEEEIEDKKDVKQEKKLNVKIEPKIEMNDSLHFNQTDLNQRDDNSDDIPDLDLEEQNSPDVTDTVTSEQISLQTEDSAKKSEDNMENKENLHPKKLAKNECKFCGKMLSNAHLSKSSLDNYRSRHRQVCEMFLALFDLRNRKCRICSHIIPNKYEKHFEKLHPDRLYPQDQESEKETIIEPGNALEPEMPVLEIQEFAKIHSTPKKQDKPTESFKSPELPKNICEKSTIIEDPEELLKLKNEEIIPNFNDPTLFQNVIQNPEEPMTNPDSNTVPNSEELGFQQEKSVDKSFFSVTSDFGGSVSTAGLTQDTGDGEVSSFFPCPFCSKKYLSLNFAEKHVQNFHSISPERLSQLNIEIKATELQ